jgi:hypothetical protein
LDYAYSNTLLIPGGSNLLLGRQKIASNVSPMPRTRIFTDYSFFDNTLLLGVTPVHRWTPGFEYAFDDQTSSVELRVPMGITISSDIATGLPEDSHYELGNLFLAWKSLLLERQNWLLSGGISLTVPTGDNINVYAGNSLPAAQHLLQIQNESVHIQPFLGWSVQNRKLFAQGFCQVDVDVNGSPVLVNRNPTQNNLSSLGVVQDSTLLYLDMQFGFWLHRDERQGRSSSQRGITGLAPVWEIHVNRSLQDTDIVGSTTNFAASGGYQVGSPISDLQIINTVIGIMIERNFQSQLYVGFATPLGNGIDAPFDGELRVAFNRYF